MTALEHKLYTALLGVMGSALVSNGQHNPMTCDQLSCRMAQQALRAFEAIEERELGK